MKTNKYNYFVVIQQNWGSGWDDVDFYETNSGFEMDKETRNAFKENIQLYRSEQAAPVRTIHRKELKSN